MQCVTNKPFMLSVVMLKVAVLSVVALRELVKMLGFVISIANKLGCFRYKKFFLKI
jgi:hypothetical protein